MGGTGQPGWGKGGWGLRTVGSQAHTTRLFGMKCFIFSTAVVPLKDFNQKLFKDNLSDSYAEKEVAVIGKSQIN